MWSQFKVAHTSHVCKILTTQMSLYNILVSMAASMKKRLCIFVSNVAKILPQNRDFSFITELTLVSNHSSVNFVINHLN